VADARNFWEGQKTDLEAKTKGRAGQGLRGPERTKVEQGIVFCGKVIWFDDFIKRMAEGNARIHFRIFMEIDGKQVDLVRTEPPGKGKKKKA
jgi:hypothetical protein